MREIQWTKKNGARNFVLKSWENSYDQWKGHPHGYVIRTSKRGGAIIAKGMTVDAAWMNAATFLLQTETPKP